MITAVDSNIFLDILAGNAKEEADAKVAMDRAVRDGLVVLSVVVYAELAARLGAAGEPNRFLQTLSASVTQIDLSAAHLAGQYFREYRERGGNRTRILPDFLIAAHAQLSADRILTRDNRFFGTQFPRLKAISPADLV
jgi:predicted nucleic acid-binding protein